ncbi:hypothetical protein CDN99_26015 [Roseateles aquatilis]|uniref:Uncharacterized protein n=1 Tax=Roseateles aquatilis TaxID=431061 RepID=A0A246IV16_9BURK|nr:hypothetical protein [Roseateles aquatilis]OWQ83589.1 hypothetical protein CDN99_26015 [Roseateles aquatilis]
MGKLLALKEWVTLEDAAAHLQRELEETVRPADVLQLALDGALRVSVRFASGGALARLGQTRTAELEFDGVGAPILDLGGEPKAIDGLWDLSLAGEGAIEIERRMQLLLGGPTVESFSPAGLFLTTPNECLWAALVELDIRGVAVDHSIEAEGPRGGKLPLVTVARRYFPLHELPDGAVIVVRPAELTALIRSLTLSAPPAAGAVVVPIRAVPAQRAQEEAVLQKLRDLGFDPLKLPKAPPGKASEAKQAVRHAMGYSADVLDKAWKRLRSDGHIVDAG